MFYTDGTFGNETIPTQIQRKCFSFIFFHSSFNAETVVFACVKGKNEVIQKVAVRNKAIGVGAKENDASNKKI